MLKPFSTPFAENINHLFLLGNTVVICGICISFIPYCKKLWQLSLLVAVDGAAMGILDTVV